MLSIVFVCMNGLFTSTLLTREFSQFFIKRQGLRVFTPRGEQRPAYQLRMPYRYAIPLVGVSAVLHWMLSEATFFEELQIQDFTKYPNETISQAIVICNMLALFCLIIVWVVVMLFIIIFAKVKKLPRGIPVLRSNSIAISTACHPAKGAQNEAYKRLKWGSIENGHHHRFGLSSNQVEVTNESRLRLSEQPPQFNE